MCIRTCFPPHNQTQNRPINDEIAHCIPFKMNLFENSMVLTSKSTIFSEIHLFELFREIYLNLIRTCVKAIVMFSSKLSCGTRKDLRYFTS